MPRFDNETIEKYGNRIAKVLKVTIKCDEFGRNWGKDNRFCQTCQIDSKGYHAKCREFSLGIKTGYKPRKNELPKRKKRFKMKVVYKAPNKRILQPFRRGSRLDVLYKFIKLSEAVTVDNIMQHVSEEFECDVTQNSVRKSIQYMRQQLSKVGHEKVVNYQGYYYFEKTQKGKIYETKEKGN